MATTTPLKYASSDFITSLTDAETTGQSKINSAAAQVLTTTNFNNVYTPINGIDTADSRSLVTLEKQFEKDYKYGALEVFPVASVSAKNANFGCKAAPEYATKNNINMTRIDNGYHTFNTCSNKAAMSNKKYFSIVKPLAEAGVKDPNRYECYGGNDPIMNATDAKSSNNYYDYVVCWTMGPTLKTFGVDANTGDVIITADNIANMGLKQSKYSDTVTNYTYGNAATYLPPNTFVSFRTYIFDLNQISISGGFMNGGYVGRDIPLANFALLNGTTDQFIVSVQDGPYTKMVRIQIAIGNSQLYPSLPSDGSLYAKALEAKYSGLCRYVRITASCGNDNWLQISEVQVFDENGVNVAKGRPAYAPNAWAWFTRPTNCTSGNASIKPYWAGYHSGTPCNGWWMVDLGKDVNISKIVYYNRQDCCTQRINGALLDGLGVNGEILYRATMNADMIQTFTVSVNNSSDLNSTWKRGINTNIVGDDRTPGYGVKGLTVRVNPVALGRGASGYASQQNAQLPAGQTSYKTVTGVDANSCQITCDNDPNCLGYSTFGTTTTETEVDPIDLGCYIDAPNRAMPTRSPNGNKDSCLAYSRNRGHKCFGLQYGGECWSTPECTPGGFDRYGKENRQPCYALGGGWQNHVYKRNFQSKTVSNCNFYGENIGSGSEPAQGSNISIRSKTSAPVNNTTFNMTNNAIKLDLSQCGSNACKFRLELGTDGNLKLYKLASANGTVSSSSTGEVVWDLFSSDSTVADKVKAIAPITQLDWKTAFNNGSNNILSSGESLPTKKQLISSNGQFKLEIVDGYLQLKAAVYGCFSTDQTYKNTSSPMYTKAVSNGAQSFYVYQSDLAHPKIGSMYYTVTGPNGYAMREIDRTNQVVLGGNTYTKLDDIYTPLQDVNPTAITVSSANECQSKCNTSPGCKYVYVKDNKCLLGNKNQPSFIPPQSDVVGDRYDLYLRQSTLDTTKVTSKTSLNPQFEMLPSKNYRDKPITLLGPLLEGPQDIGPLASPLGAAILRKQKSLFGIDEELVPTKGTPAVKPSIYPTSEYSSPPKPVDNTKPASSIAQSLFEGFDPHNWKDPGENCGQGNSPTCYAGILYGQLKPLQAISQDYSSQLNKMNTMYSDISGNIGQYRDLYTSLNNDAKYDFAGNQPIVFSGNTDLLTEMKNDSKQLALQTNNMYIAGSILTTTLLVSAIYLGRS